MAPPDDDTTEIDVRRYFDAVGRRLWVIVLITAVVTGSALFVSSRQTPRYKASAQLLLQPRLGDPLSAGASPYVDPDRLVKTEMQVLKSPPVEAEVQRRLGFTPDVSATPLTQTNVMSLQAVSADPATAARIANTYSEAYIAVRQSQLVDELVSASRQVEAKIGGLQRQIDALRASAASLSPRERPNPAEEAQLNALITQQGMLRQKLDEFNIDAGVRAGGAQLMVPASIPAAPFSPDTRRNGLLGLGMGLVIGVAYALLREFLDDSIKSQEDLSRSTDGAPVLGVIPYVSRWRSKRGEAISLAEPSSPAAEAYRTLRTSIKFLRLDTPLQLLQVTSSGAKEGKTSTVANLGVALAMAGQRVVVVCCDLRQPRLHELFGLDNSVGLTSVVLGEATLSDALQPIPGSQSLRLLASGPLPPNPAELLSSRRAASVLAALRAEADIVILDCPPLIPVTDAVVLSELVDATVLLATANMTKRKQVARAVEVLRQVNAPLVGAVLNGLKVKSGYGYDRRYGQRPARPRKRRAGRSPGAPPADVSVDVAGVNGADTPLSGVSAVSARSADDTLGNGNRRSVAARGSSDGGSDGHHPEGARPPGGNEVVERVAGDPLQSTEPVQSGQGHDQEHTVTVADPPSVAGGHVAGSGSANEAAPRRIADAEDRLLPGLTVVEPASGGAGDGSIGQQGAIDDANAKSDLPDWFRVLFRAAVEAPVEDDVSRLGVANGADFTSEMRETEGFRIESLVILPGASTECRTHESSHVIVYARKGTAGVRFGQDFETSEVLEVGNFCLIPAATPYKLANASDTDWLEVMLAQRSRSRPPDPGRVSAPEETEVER